MEPIYFMYKCVCDSHTTYTCTISIMTTIHHQLRICRRSRLFRCSIFYSHTSAAAACKCALLVWTQFFAMQCDRRGAHARDVRPRIEWNIRLFRFSPSSHGRDYAKKRRRTDGKRRRRRRRSDATATEQMFFANECNRPKYLRTWCVHMNANRYHYIRTCVYSSTHPLYYSTILYIKCVRTLNAPEHTTLALYRHFLVRTSYPLATDHHSHTYVHKHTHRLGNCISARRTNVLDPRSQSSWWNW